MTVEELAERLSRLDASLTVRNSRDHRFIASLSFKKYDNRISATADKLATALDDVLRMADMVSPSAIQTSDTKVV